MDPVQFDLVITNLCINGRDAIQGSGEITISTAMIPVDPAEKRDHPCFSRETCVVLKVTDTGSGMDDRIMGHIFEPFFTISFKPVIHDAALQQVLRL